MKKQTISLFFVVLMLLSACTTRPHNSINQSTNENSAQGSTPTHPPTYLQSFADLQAHYAQKIATGLHQYESNIASNGFPIPCQNGAPVTLDSTSDCPITIFDCELYREPWIWYHSNIGQSTIHIKMMLNQELLSEFDETSSASDIIRSIDPSAPNVNNFNSENYIYVEECTIATADGQKSALIKKAAEYGELYITFLQDGFLVVLMTYEESIDEEWLSSFSIMQSNAIMTPEDVPALTIESYSEYISFLEHTDLPDQFVSYDMIAQFGAFDSFVCLADARYGDYSSYMYNLVDVAADDADIVLYVDQDGSTIDTSQQTALKGVNTENMRCLSTEESGAFISNGIEYYYVNGLLLSIKWQVEDTLFTLSGRGLLDGYPQEAVSTPIGNMMNIQSAESVIEAITISIKSER